MDSSGLRDYSFGHASCTPSLTSSDWKFSSNPDEWRTARGACFPAAQYAASNQELEDRVRVLERIVTDRGYDVATQIEALRDTRRVEELDAGVPLGVAKREQA